jgi:hypothetical protein
MIGASEDTIPGWRYKIAGAYREIATEARDEYFELFHFSCLSTNRSARSIKMLFESARLLLFTDPNNRRYCSKSLHAQSGIDNDNHHCDR